MLIGFRRVALVDCGASMVLYGVDICMSGSRGWSLCGCPALMFGRSKSYSLVPEGESRVSVLYPPMLYPWKLVPLGKNSPLQCYLVLIKWLLLPLQVKMGRILSLIRSLPELSLGGVNRWQEVQDLWTRRYLQGYVFPQYGHSVFHLISIIVAKITLDQYCSVHFMLISCCCSLISSMSGKTCFVTIDWVITFS